MSNNCTCGGVLRIERWDNVIWDECNKCGAKWDERHSPISEVQPILISSVVANAATCQTIAHQYNTGKGYHSHYMNRTQETVRDLMLAGF